MKQSLLELTQEILSALDSDEINSIEDTAEARQVAKIIRTTYFNIIARANLPEHQQMFALNASGDEDLPVLMTKPENVAVLDWVKYDMAEDASEDSFEYVTILPLQQFMDKIHSFDITEADVESMEYNDITFYYKNDKMPEYCTIIDDETIIFDSYDADIDDTLQSSKTVCFGQINPSFSMGDEFTPNLDEQQFPLLLNEAKSLAFLELKQIAHEKAEQESRRQWRTLQRTKKLKRPSDFDQLAHFGRR